MARRRLAALAAVVALLVATALAPAAESAQGAPAAPGRAVPADGAAAGDAGRDDALWLPLIVALGAVTIVAIAGAVRQETGRPRAGWDEMGRAWTGRLRRGARGGRRIGQAWGGRLRRAAGDVVEAVRRDDRPQAVVGGAHRLPAAGPSEAPALTRGAAGRILDLVCLPVPVGARSDLWQLTAVDVETGETWAELTDPQMAEPPPEQVAAFVRRCAGDLAEHGAELDGVVVRRGTPHRLMLRLGVELAHVTALQLPGSAHRPVAAQRHRQLVAEHWNHVLTESSVRRPDLLDRQLQRWLARENADVATRTRAAPLRPVPTETRNPPPGW